MKKLWDDRRLFISFVSVIGLFVMGWFKGLDIGYHIVTICGVVAGANVVEKMKK